MIKVRTINGGHTCETDGMVNTFGYEIRSVSPPITGANDIVITLLPLAIYKKNE
ncbi:MAG: hypothetical protein PHY16_00265 [Methylobacter sp.]|nr:hypothetical protein [Methylobacter sp.]